LHDATPPLRQNESMAFADNLKRLMARQNVSRIDIAAALGVSAQAVSQWMSGRTQPVGRRLTALAAVLRVPVTALVEEPGGLTEQQGPIQGAPEVETAHEDEQFAELAAALEAMLLEEHMPADTRTVSRLARVVWRDMEVYRSLPFEDRLALTLSAHRSKLKQARVAIFQKAR
jgi:transcriptional regulator with XRE-family HTH domain